MLYAGDDIKLAFTATESETGDALNLSGLSIKWALSRQAGGKTLLTKDLATGGINVISAALGTFEVVLGPTDTDGFSGTYYHEVRVFEGTKPYTVYSGELEFAPTLIPS